MSRGCSRTTDSQNPSPTRRGAGSPEGPSSRPPCSESRLSSSTRGARPSSATTAWRGFRRASGRGSTSAPTAAKEYQETRTPLFSSRGLASREEEEARPRTGARHPQSKGFCPPSGRWQARAKKREAYPFRGRRTSRLSRQHVALPLFVLPPPFTIELRNFPVDSSARHILCIPNQLEETLRAGSVDQRGGTEGQTLIVATHDKGSLNDKTA